MQFDLLGVETNDLIMEDQKFGSDNAISTKIQALIILTDGFGHILRVLGWPGLLLAILVGLFEKYLPAEKKIEFTEKIFFPDSNHITIYLSIIVIISLLIGLSQRYHYRNRIKQCEKERERLQKILEHRQNGGLKPGKKG